MATTQNTITNNGFVAHDWLLLGVILLRCDFKIRNSDPAIDISYQENKMKSAPDKLQSSCEVPCTLQNLFESAGED